MAESLSVNNLTRQIAREEILYKSVKLPFCYSISDHSLGELLLAALITELAIFSEVVVDYINEVWNYR